MKRCPIYWDVIMNEIAAILDDAVLGVQAVPQISHTRQISLSEAYHIQDLVLQRRLQRTEKMIGVKLGFTSKAKMEQMGVEDIIWGSLTDGMRYQSGEEMRMQEFIHPRAEPEIAFLMDRSVDDKITRENISSYVRGISVALEIIDSRYENFKFSLADVIADNCSAAAFVTGQWFPVETPIGDIDITLTFNNQVMESGNSSAILGDPWNSLWEAVRLLKSHHHTLAEGQVVLAGAATASRFFQKGDLVEAHAQGLGSVGLRMV